MRAVDLPGDGVGVVRPDPLGPAHDQLGLMPLDQQLMQPHHRLGDPEDAALVAESVLDLLQQADVLEPREQMRQCALLGRPRAPAISDRR
ncbi:hypothetical protein [Streptomyces sp. RTd22]|uniref:hypothetical protein n=2 Tax=Streptomyces sp. RTd22 TaxID=1841249 RepID=UPI0013316889|nr:hypothetical protein [Streptomyces sp. RTd22]